MRDREQIERRGMRQFGELEAAIMDVMWASDGPVPVRAVVDALTPARSPAYTTVQTVMDILHRKGWLAREKNGRAYDYWPLASREEYSARLIDDVLSAAPDRTAVLAKFFSEMDPDEAAELRQALGKAKRKRRNS